MMTHRTAGCRASFTMSEHLTTKAPYDGEVARGICTVELSGVSA
jgi:hypothetical protein